MVAQLNHHIELISTNPLDATMTGRNTKAYIVAQYALASDTETTAKDYNLSVGAVYAALSFYADNQEAIENALQTSRALDLSQMELSDARLKEIQRNVNE
ncbi:MAG: hypothetical protein AAFV93_18650 [Chloroflexota bacterium]